VDVSCSS